VSPLSCRDFLGAGGALGARHDPTSVLATIERTGGLPAPTYRHANASTPVDVVDLSQQVFREPPAVAPPLRLIPGLLADLEASL
jgi:hypothetical protein